MLKKNTIVDRELDRNTLIKSTYFNESSMGVARTVFD
jgi:hypothetical protein